MMSDGDLLACLTVIHLLYVSHTTPPYLPPSFPPSLPPLTLIATHCAPRSPKSSTNTAYNGILLQKGTHTPFIPKCRHITTDHPSLHPSLPPLTLIATHCAPRSPKSSTNTAYNGILLKKGLTRPLSRKAAINKLSFPAIRSMFLGVNPPVINNPPNGIHLSPATPASDP